jgi:hypothetical protein
LLQHLADAQGLNSVNYSDDRFRHAIDGIKGIHSAFVHHNGIYPKNILVVPGNPERVVWIDFDVASTFTGMEPCEKAILQLWNQACSKLWRAFGMFNLIVMTTQNLTIAS